MVRSLFALLVCAVLAAPGRADETQRQDRTAAPNIVFFYLDDLGYGDVSCLNPESKIQTPNIDRLAAEGMTLTDAHSAAAVCTPSRYAVMTGRYPWRSRMKNGTAGVFSPPLIEAGRRTVADLLRENGYRTGLIGKWHLGQRWQLKNDGDYEKAFSHSYALYAKLGDPGVDFTKPLVDGPNQHGFDYAIWKASTPAVAENGKILGSIKIVRSNRKHGYRDPRLEDEDLMPTWVKSADAFVRDASLREQPFFLYYALTAPHTPHAPNEPFLGKSEAGVYGDYVMECDWALGELMKSLRAAGVERNTLIFVTSDNGPANNMVRIEAEFGHRACGDYRGRKRMNFEGGHRMPTFARWPGVIAPGSVSNETVSQVDFFATCAQIVGARVAPDEAEDSLSILGALRGDRSFVRGAAIVHVNATGDLGIRAGDWVLLMHAAEAGMHVDPFDPEKPDPLPCQLYNLAKDPRQQQNLYAKHPEKAAELRELLKGYVVQGRSTPGVPQKNDDPFPWADPWFQIEWTRTSGAPKSGIGFTQRQ